MDDNAIIRVNNVSKDFVLPHEKVTSIKGLFTGLARRRNKSTEIQHALKDISFDVKNGEFFGIVGRNGSGKSTLLKILAGIYQPNQGSIQIGGRVAAFIELGVGFNGELTGRENVYLGGALMGFSQQQIDNFYGDVVSFAELGQSMDQKLKNYSSGMQVRLAFSLAIRAETDILLVDEVLAVGDADFQRKCFDYFRKLKKDKKTVVFVTHNMDAVREYCDRAILIDNSQILVSGTAVSVATKYTKMFTEAVRHSQQDGESKKRWGDEAIRYSKVSVEPKTLKPGADLKILLQAKAERDVESPVFGFLIKNGAATHITGTNNQIIQQKVPVLKAGDIVDLEWTVPNIFNDGLHYIDPAIVHEDGTATADWWEEAASFTVVRQPTTSYIVSPDMSLKFKVHAKD